MNRSLLLAVLLLPLGLAGCAALGAPPSAPAARHRAVVVRDARRAALPPRLVHEVRAGAARYADRLDRALRLDRRQERAVRALVTDRALDFVYQHPRGAPFPREQAERLRDGRRWWSRTDREVEKLLSGPQRRAYRDLLRYERRRHERRRHERRRHERRGYERRGYERRGYER